MGAKQGRAVQNGSADKSTDNFAFAASDTNPYQGFLDQAASIAQSAWQSDQKEQAIVKLKEANEVLVAERDFLNERVSRLTATLQESQDKYLAEYSQHMRYNAQKGLVRPELSVDKYNAIHQEGYRLANLKFEKHKAVCDGNEATRLADEASMQAANDAKVKGIREKYKKQLSTSSSTRPLASAIAKKAPVGKGKAVAKKKSSDDNEPRALNAYQNYCAANMHEYKEAGKAANDAGEEFTTKWPNWFGPKWAKLSEEERQKWETPRDEGETPEAGKPAAKPAAKASAAAAAEEQAATEKQPAAKPAAKPAAESAKKKSKPPAKPKAPEKHEEDKDEDEEVDEDGGGGEPAIEVQATEVEDDVEEVEDEADEADEAEAEADEADEADDPPEAAAKRKRAEEDDEEDEAKEEEDEEDEADEAGEAGEAGEGTAKRSKPLTEASQKELEELDPSDDEKGKKGDDEKSNSSKSSDE